MAKQLINHLTESIAKSDVDAALAALGIDPEHLKDISDVHIGVKEVTIHAYARSEKGGIQVITTPYGNIAAGGSHVFKIDRDA